MGRRGSVLTLVIINVIVTLVVIFAVFAIAKPQFGSQQPQQVPMTVQILITATKDPNLTQTIKIITATPLPGTPGVVSLPTGLFDGQDGTIAAAPTIDPAVFGENNTLQLTATALPANCILYTIKDGDTPFGIATEYGIDGNDLMGVNGLDDQSAALLQIGQVIIVPLAGCSLPVATAAVVDMTTEEPTVGSPVPTGTAVTETAAPTLKPTASNTPTATLPPTATNAQVEIVRVLSPGDINAEGVDVRNNGAVVDLTGWKLSTSSGTIYTFPQQRLFTGSVLTVYTRVGTDTPTAKFWGKDTALWSSGATLTLTDAAGHTQSTYIVP